MNGLTGSMRPAPILASDRNFAVDTQDYELRFPSCLMGQYSWIRAQMDPLSATAWGAAVVVIEGRIAPDSAKWEEIDSTMQFTAGTEIMVGPIDAVAIWEARLRVKTVGTAGLRYAAYLLAVGGLL